MAGNAGTICPFCFQKEVFHVRFDRNRKPYWTCDLCKMKIFVTSALALGSVYFWTRTLEACNGESLMRAQEQAKTLMRSGGSIYGKVCREDLSEEKLPMRETVGVGQ